MQDTPVLHAIKSCSIQDSAIIPVHACHVLMSAQIVTASSTNLAACHFCTSFLDPNIKPLQDKGRLQVSQNPPNKVGLAAVQLFLSLHFLKWTRGTEIVCLQTIETGEGIAQLCMQPHDKQRGSKRYCCDFMQDIISIRLRDSSAVVDHI